MTRRQQQTVQQLMRRIIFCNEPESILVECADEQQAKQLFNDLKTETEKPYSMVIKKPNHD